MAATLRGGLSASVVLRGRCRWRALLDRGRPDPGSAAGASSGQPNVLLDMHGRLVAAFSQQSVPLNRVSWAMQSAGKDWDDARDLPAGTLIST